VYNIINYNIIWIEEKHTKHKNKKIKNKNENEKKLKQPSNRNYKASVFFFFKKMPIIVNKAQKTYFMRATVI
jgi:hypothetical protein